MASVFLITDDLLPFASIEEEKAEQMIGDAEALAALAAPCLFDGETVLTDVQTAAVRALLRAAVLRWHDSGSGALQSETVGPYSAALDTRAPRRGMFWPSEISQLQDICGGTTSGGAFSIDTTPGGADAHLLWCSINFAALYCSCGVDIAGYPIFEDA